MKKIPEKWPGQHQTSASLSP